MKVHLLLVLIIALIAQGCSTEGTVYHVSIHGSDQHIGSESKPLKSITAAAKKAQPGDLILVHEGVYREQVNPPRGGNSDQERIVYKAADGEKVIIKGSEVIKNWEQLSDSIWKVVIPNTYFGDFNPYSDKIHGDWFQPTGRKHHTGAVYLNGHWLTEAAHLDSVICNSGSTPYWFAQVDSIPEGNTTIWAQFENVNPNQEEVEINVRQTVFYPRQTGINYITLSGFTLEQAATPWAPPTAEQIGLIGTHWSRGWIIENNTIRYSTCVGVTLGKHGDEWDNTSENSAEGYVLTIERATEQGWSKENIGHHVVRNNTISHCEQAGLVGSMGAVFSTIENNKIHDIHTRRMFTGAEMAGIKIHGAVDSKIQHNLIFNCNRGIWLDWMTQGTHVTRNIMHSNFPNEDLFMEVNHGPVLVDNNLLMSDNALLVNSQGAAYVHNIIAGRIHVIKGEKRLTPHLENHGTRVVGLAPNNSGDERFFNNLLVGKANLGAYDDVVLPVYMAGNVFINGAKPAKAEEVPLVVEMTIAEPKLINKTDGLYLEWQWDEVLAQSRKRELVTTCLLGVTEIPQLPFVQVNGQPYVLDKDFLGKQRDTNPMAGPFVVSKSGPYSCKIW